MSIDSIGKALLLSILPPGAAWKIKSDDDWDHLLDALGENKDDLINKAKNLAFIRNPLKTLFLNELEDEYGIISDPTISEDIRRARLKSIQASRITGGTADDMQDALRTALFDVYVYPNDPAIDPDIFLDKYFQMTCNQRNLQGELDAYCGSELAYCGKTGAWIIVNGDLFYNQPIYLSVLNAHDEIGLTAYCGNPDFVCGAFDNTEIRKLNYFNPGDPNYWHLFFFVGGLATFDIEGKITSIQQVLIPIERKAEFLELIIRHKPLSTWGIFIGQFT